MERFSTKMSASSSNRLAFQWLDSSKTSDRLCSRSATVCRDHQRRSAVLVMSLKDELGVLPCKVVYEGDRRWSPPSDFFLHLVVRCVHLVSVISAVRHLNVLQESYETLSFASNKVFKGRIRTSLQMSLAQGLDGFVVVSWYSKTVEGKMSQFMSSNIKWCRERSFAFYTKSVSETLNVNALIAASAAYGFWLLL